MTPEDEQTSIEDEREALELERLAIEEDREDLRNDGYDLARKLEREYSDEDFSSDREEYDRSAAALARREKEFGERLQRFHQRVKDTGG